MPPEPEKNETSGEHEGGKFYTYFVDGKEYTTDQATLTCGVIMDRAGIPRSVGMVQVLEDGTEQACPENEVIDFQGPGRRFKKAPRFKRG